MANKTQDKFYIISDSRVLYGPVKWSGKLIDMLRWYRDVMLCDNIYIVQVFIDEKTV